MPLVSPASKTKCSCVMPASSNCRLLEGSFSPRNSPALVRYQLSSVVHHESQLWDLEHAGKIEPIDVWVKVDTRMHRIGFPPESIPAVIKRLKVCMAVGRVRVMSHFPTADNRFDVVTPDQIRLLDALTLNLNVERSLANSAGIVNWPSSHLDGCGRASCCMAQRP